MAEAVLFNIAESLLKNLGSKALEEVAATWGFKDQLEKLKDTANTIKDVLYDAEQRQVESQAVRGWLERLRSVVYDADDLFDEFSTMVMKKELMTCSTLSKEDLVIMGCDRGLRERCKGPNGDDWPKIQHIPRVEVFP